MFGFGLCQMGKMTNNFEWDAVTSEAKLLPMYTAKYQRQTGLHRLLWPNAGIHIYAPVQKIVKDSMKKSV